MSFDISNYHVVDFHFIDDGRCLSPLADSNVDGMEPLTKAEIIEKRSLLEKIFKDAGWEGDGDVNCIFLAPCFSGDTDGHCNIIYHVKQSNNGTSWLAIPKWLDLELPTGFLSKV